MSLKIVCAVHLVRHPVGGHSWHHLQYLLGLRSLGHEVTFFENYGWADSCYDPVHNIMSPDPTFGITYLKRLLPPDLAQSWCYLSEDGTPFGMSREELTEKCSESDLFLNLSGVNWIPELEYCRRRVLVDTDPVFTQIGGFGWKGASARHHVLFTYGENVHRPGCEMPTGDAHWLPTRQPVVPELWPVSAGDPSAPFTTVINWAAYGARQHEGKTYGQKDVEFARFLAIPNETREPFQAVLSAPPEVRANFVKNGWVVVNGRRATRDPWVYQDYLADSRAEFSAAKHAYVVTKSGWFSDRSSAYLAMGRPVIVQDTGFTNFLPSGAGLLPFRTMEEAVAAVKTVNEDYPEHCRAARKLVEEYFAASDVLTRLIEQSL